MRREI